MAGWNIGNYLTLPVYLYGRAVDPGKTYTVKTLAKSGI